MTLKDLLNEQRSCSRCNICKWIPVEKYKRRETQAGCPAIEKYQFHSYSAGGKQHMCIGLNEGKIDFNESVMDIAYRCHFCGACEFACKVYRPDMDVSDTFDELRKECVNRGLVPEAHRKMMNNLEKTGDPHGREAKEDWTKQSDVKLISADQRGTYFLYAGPEAKYVQAASNRTAKVATLLMNKGLDLISAGMDESNSGYEAFILGHIELGIAQAKQVKQQIEASGAKTVIVMDAHSFATFRNYYPKYDIALGVEIKHITEVMADLLEQGNIEFAGELQKTVTYHDPCYLGRRSDPYKPPFEGPKDMRPVALSRTGQLGIYDAPRKILAAIPGVKLEEMDRIREYAWCCGGGAGVSEAYPELTESTAKARIEEADLTGADILVTACPNCEYILGKAAGGMRVADVLDLMLEEGGAR